MAVPGSLNITAQLSLGKRSHPAAFDRIKLVYRQELALPAEKRVISVGQDRSLAAN